MTALQRQKQEGLCEFKASLEGLRSELQDSQGYVERPSISKKKNPIFFVRLLQCHNN